MTERIIDAEVIEEKPPETRVVQLDPQLEIERLKTTRAQIAATISEKRWGASAVMIVGSSAFISCAQMCNPWGG